MESEYPECPICLDIYGINQNHIKAPKVLNCGHSLCKDCLQQIIDKEEGEYIICPTCNQKIKKNLNVDDYITNFEVIKLVNSYFGLSENKDENQEGTNKPISFNIISLGASGVGKSSIFQRLLKNAYNGNHLVTIGIDFSFYYIKYKNLKYKLFFLDTGGQEKYHAMARSYFKKSDGALFIFDLSDEKSFKSIENWYNSYKEEKKDIVGILIGNKNDLQRKVGYEKAKKFAEEHDLKYLETSAKYDKNIKKAIIFLLENLIESKAIYNSFSSIDTKYEPIKLSNEPKHKKFFCCF